MGYFDEVKPQPHTRRQCLGLGGLALVGALGLHPSSQTWAQQAANFLLGPPVKDIEPIRLAARTWMIYSEDGFPTAKNQGMMANIVFTLGEKGVAVLDSGCSLQIGEMALRMIKKITSKPVVAVINSHYHGDHWLGNHAFVNAYGSNLPIYALEHTIQMIKGLEGEMWRTMMERWTNEATLGTKVYPPNKMIKSADTLDLGGITLKAHHYGHAHTPSDLCIEIVEDKVTMVGDIAMGNRIANMDDGSYPGTFRYYESLNQAAGQQLWVPGHGRPSKTLLQDYELFLRGIWEPCLKAVQDGQSESVAKEWVLADPRVSARAKTMQGFANNIGKYISLAYLEAEKLAF
jgi:glyoxylase-like metal-dependent hydrolase (beta-lactamase superfamily II)